MKTAFPKTKLPFFHTLIARGLAFAMTVGLSSVACGAAGDLFVTDLQTNSIVVYSPDGSQRTFATGLDSPQGLVFDSLGNLFVADNGSGSVYKYGADGTRTVFASGLQGPVGLSFTTSTKQLLVSEHDGDQVTGFSSDGTNLGSKPLSGVVKAVVRNLTNDPNVDSLNTTWFVSNASPAASFLQDDIDGGPSNTFLSGLDLQDIDFAPFPAGSAYDTAFASSTSGDIYGVSTMDDGMGGLATNEFIFTSGLGDLHGLAFRPSIFGDNGSGNLFAADTAGGNIFAITAQPTPSVSTFATGGQPNYLAFEAILPAKLQNISTRGQVLTGENVLIVGFIVTGDDGSSRNVVLRGIGPSLSEQDPPVLGALPNPMLQLYDEDGFLVSNDDWLENSAADQMTLTDSGLAPTSDLEAALVQNLAPGAYTAILSGVNNGTGIGMVEVYDLDSTEVGDLDVVGELGNISTRGLVGTGDNVLIAGFFMGPSDAGRVLIRAIGPELVARGVSNSLDDPTLDLHDQNGTMISSNDNWADTAEGEISASGLAPTDPAEAAILINLPANSLPYTAIVSGTNGSTGVALVEAYHLP